MTMGSPLFALLKHMPLLVLVLLLGNGLLPAAASHVRYGSVTWEPVPNRTNTISITVRLAYRKDMYRGSSQVGIPFRGWFERLRWGCGLAGGPPSQVLHGRWGGL